LKVSESGRIPGLGVIPIKGFSREVKKEFLMWQLVGTVEEKGKVYSGHLFFKEQNL
jgi:hypothetical protein